MGGAAGTLPRAEPAESWQTPLRQQRRIAAGFLINEQSWDAAAAASAVGFARTSDAALWAARLAEFGHVRDDGARRGPKRKLTEEHGRVLGAALEEDRIGRGVARVAEMLVKQQKLPAADRKTYVKALKAVDYDISMSRNDLGLSDEEKAARLCFCRRVRDDRLGYRASFSDSKVFFGGSNYRQGRARRVWTKKGKPRRESRKKAPYKARMHSLGLTHWSHSLHDARVHTW